MCQKWLVFAWALHYQTERQQRCSLITTLRINWPKSIHLIARSCFLAFRVRQMYFFGILLCNLWLASRVLTLRPLVLQYSVENWSTYYCINQLIKWCSKPQGFLWLQFLLTHAKLVYARGYIVAFIFKLSHFIIPNNDSCGTPFIDNAIRGVPVCKVDSNQFINKSRIRYTTVLYLNSESLLKRLSL